MKAGVESIRRWASDRLPIEAAQEFATHKTVPVHRWSVLYYFGGMTLFFFCVQVVLLKQLRVV